MKVSRTIIENNLVKTETMVKFALDFPWRLFLEKNNDL